MSYISATAEIMYAPFDLRLADISSFALLRISPADSRPPRRPHARKPAQHVRAFGPSFRHLDLCPQLFARIFWAHLCQLLPQLAGFQVTRFRDHDLDLDDLVAAVTFLRC